MIRDDYIITGLIALIVGAIATHFARIIPQLLHRGHIDEIREAIISSNSDTIADLRNSIDQIKAHTRRTDEAIEQLRTSVQIIQALRDEDKRFMNDLTNRLLRLEERLDDRITELERRITDNLTEFQRSILYELKHGQKQD